MKDFTVFVISDGTATTAGTVTRAVLAQFPEVKVELKLSPRIMTNDEISQVIQQAAEKRGVIVYTLVSPELRSMLFKEARAANVPAIDLLGPLLLRLEDFFHIPPKGIPGIFKPSPYGDDPRIEAINFAVDHDDGKGISSLDQADIVIVGISRTSKTPLSIYLASRGWKVANVPIIPGVRPFEVLDQIDQKKIIGLTIEAEPLSRIRKRRMEKFHLGMKNTYSDLASVQKEISYAESFYQEHPAWPVIEVTNKSIEEIAQEAIGTLTQRNLNHR